MWLFNLPSLFRVANSKYELRLEDMRNKLLKYIMSKLLFKSSALIKGLLKFFIGAVGFLNLGILNCCKVLLD